MFNFFSKQNNWFIKEVYRNRRENNISNFITIIYLLQDYKYK